jgi:hypothetical protein
MHRAYLLSARRNEVTAGPGNRGRYRRRCRNRMNVSEPETEIRPKSAANSILTSNHLTSHRIDYGND